MREFIVDLTNATKQSDFIAAFNDGFCRHVGGHLYTWNLAAFNDYLSWPDEGSYQLTFKNWKRIRGIIRSKVTRIFRDNPHVEVTFQEDRE